MHKIAVDCRMIDSGGIGTYLKGILPYFIAKADCLLIGTHEQCMAYLRLPNVEFCYCDVKPFSIREMYFFPKDIAEKINTYDIFYTPYCNIPSGLRIPVYTTIHDVIFLDMPGLASRTGTAVRRHLYKKAVRKSETVFTVSQFSKERILANLNCKKPVVVAYDGVPEWLKRDDDDDDADIVKTETILFVGNIKKHKGLHILIPAFVRALGEGLTAQLVIVGNADNFRSGDDTIAGELAKTPPESVRFTGRIADKELKRLYKSAKLLVQPSLYEGFGLPPLEALTLGTRVLISDIPVFREIYKNLPVCFFKSGDSKDLTEKLLAAYDKAETPFELPETYSFERTARLIQEAFEASMPFSRS